MEAGFSFFQYVEQALRGLMVLISGGLLGTAAPEEREAQQLEMDSLLANRELMCALLVLETDGETDAYDADILLRRFASLGFDAGVLEQRDSHLILQVTGPTVDDSVLKRLTVPGRFVIAALESPEQWKDSVSSALQQAPGVEWTALSQNDEPSFAALEKETLQPLVQELTDQHLLPFVYCRDASFHNQGCSLHVLKPDLRLRNEDVTAVFLRLETQYGSGYFSQEIHLTPDAAERFRMLTEQNLKKPLPVLLDKEVLTMPIVQDIITGGELQITGSFLSSEQTAQEAGLDALIFRALITQPPLSKSWRLVHVEPVLSPSVRKNVP